MLIGLPPSIRGLTWTRDDIRTYERALRLALLDPDMAPGFAAARMLEARANALKLVCERAVCPDNNDLKCHLLPFTTKVLGL